VISCGVRLSVVVFAELWLTAGRPFNPGGQLHTSLRLKDGVVGLWFSAQDAQKGRPARPQRVKDRKRTLWGTLRI
jgi:hypothetical protein